MESQSLVNVYTQLIFIKHLKQEYQEFKFNTINVHCFIFICSAGTKRNIEFGEGGAQVGYIILVLRNLKTLALRIVWAANKLEGGAGGGGGAEF